MSVVARAHASGSPHGDPGALRPRCASVEYSPGGHSADRIICLSVRHFLYAVVGLSAAVSLTACGDTSIEAPTVPLAQQATVPVSAFPLASGVATDGTTAAGIGGAYTMTAGGDQITGLPLAPTGVEVPAGLPVRVRVSGAITRTATEGLKAFCALPRWQASCEGIWADIVAEDPIPPSGLAAVGGRGAALISWDGGAGASPPDGSRIAVTGPAGTELWAGRISWECYYFDSYYNQGSCFTFGGGYTVTVEADDGGTPDDTANAGGSGGDSKNALLEASAVLTGGGSLHLSATATDGSTVEDPKWSFVPDSIKTVQGDTSSAPVAAPQSQAAMPSGPGSSGGHVPAGVQQLAPDRWRLPDGRVVGPGLYVVRSHADMHASRATAPLPDRDHSPHSTSTRSAPAAAPVAVDDCLYLADCITSAPDGPGTYVVSATVNGQLLSASARVGAAPAPRLSLLCQTPVTRGSKATCIASASDIRATIAVSAWHFEPDSSRFSRVDRIVDVTDLSWGGRMATSGTVVAEGVADGRQDTARAHIEVTKRDWSGMTVDFPAPEATDASDMSEYPYQVPGDKGIKELGHIHYEANAKYNLKALYVIETGPNADFGYFTGIPYVPGMVVHINLSQFLVGSNLWKLQADSRKAFESTPRCLKSQLPGLVAPIALHEGTTMDPRSHARRFAATFNKLIGPIVERLVLSPDDHPASVLDAALAPVSVQAKLDAGKADDDFPARLGCELKLFPPPPGM